jgi:hypothetical protein
MSGLTFREFIQRIAPPWLRNYVGSRFLYSLGIQLDALGDDVVLGIRARFPDIAAANGLVDALTQTGLDRQIFRGPNEPLEVYAARLKRWYDDWKIAGCSLSVLSQIQAYLTPNFTRLRIVNDRGFWCTLEADGTVEFVLSPLSGGFGNWNWDGKYGPSIFSRFWTIIYCSGGKPFDVGPRWGDPGFKYDPTKTWGTTATPAQVKSIRAIVQQWKAAHSWCQNIIIAFDPASFDPAGPQGAPLPDGTWGSYSNASVPSGRARLSTARYWKGTA